MIEFANVRGSTESSGQTHLEIAFEVTDHGDEDEEFVNASKDPPASEMFE